MSDQLYIPKLIDLPVYRTDYINQQQVDMYCKLVWKEKADVVGELAFEIDIPFEDWGNVNIPRKMAHIITYIRNIEKEKQLPPISMIGMVDLTYEILRRISIELGAGDVPIRGEQIAKTPFSPFPPVGQLQNYVWGDKNKEPKEYSPEKEKLYYKLYKEHPEVIFAATELERRALRMGEPHWFLDGYFRENLPNEIYMLSHGV